MTRRLVNIMDTDPEQERVYEGMVGGIAVYFRDGIPPGTIVFRDRDGVVIGVIREVKQIDTGGHL